MRTALEITTWDDQTISISGNELHNRGGIDVFVANWAARNPLIDHEIFLLDGIWQLVILSAE
jgi:hypothetical protein